MQAHEAEFKVRFIYVCVDSIGTSIKRVAQRAYQGGHSGSEDTVRDIRTKSLANLRRAFDELGRSIDLFEIYDNSAHGVEPKLIASFQGRQITFLHSNIPAWLDQALDPTPYSMKSLRVCFQQKQPLPEPPTSQ